MLWQLTMEILLASSLVTAEILLNELCQAFGYEDTLISQETVDNHFLKINGLKAEFNSEYAEFANRLSILFEVDSSVSGFLVYLRAGPQLQFDNYVLRFPKIIARVINDNFEHLETR